LEQLAFGYLQLSDFKLEVELGPADSLKRA